MPLFVIDICELLPGVVPHDEASRPFLDIQGGGKA
jgi:hypothetical protein